MDYIQAIRMLNFDWKSERSEKLTAVCVACKDLCVLVSHQKRIVYNKLQCVMVHSVSVPTMSVNITRTEMETVVGHVCVHVSYREHDVRKCNGCLCMCV